MKYFSRLPHNLPVNCFMSEEKVALFGGTFDPIHIGHTTVARAAADHIGADKVVFVPAQRSPLKESPPQASGQDRLKMVALAIRGIDKFEVSDYELKKSQPSYTLETVRHFRRQCGGSASIYLLVGADTVDELPYWYRVIDLIDECNLSVMYRAGCDVPDFARFERHWGKQRVARLQRNIVPTPLIDISSTEIRKRLAAGRDVSAMLQPDVAEYIRQHRLYQPKNR